MKAPSEIAAGEVVVIRSDPSWFHVPWRELYQYRDLLFLLVRRNFVSTYKQTVLGPFWYILRPLFGAVVSTIIFGHVAKLSTDGMPKFIFYLCGQLGWRYFASCVGATQSTYLGNAGLFGKVYFPRLIIPLSALVTNLLSLVIQTFTFFLFWTYFKGFTEAGAVLHIRIGLVPLLLLLVLQSGATGLGTGLWMSSLTVKYRDFLYISTWIMSVWMYASPVIYPVSMVPLNWRWLSYLNPMTSVVEMHRYVLLGEGTVVPAYQALSVLTSLLILFSGIMIFNRTGRTFVDTV